MKNFKKALLILSISIILGVGGFLLSSHNQNRDNSIKEKQYNNI